ncbi:MAG: hypothetical protein RBR22_10025 [Desulfuromonas sp.]|nr:hypothetical protein [Desulfuromonas sp.]
MKEHELYQRKMQAQLDELQADIDKLKAKAAGASATAQLEMHRQINTLEKAINEGRTKLAQLADASEEAWESIKVGVETAWHSLKSGFNEAANKFKKE